MLNLYCKKKKKKNSGYVLILKKKISDFFEPPDCYYIEQFPIQPTPSIIPHPRLFGAPGHLT